MIDGLPAVGAGVDYEAETVVEVLPLSDIFRCEEKFAKQLGIARGGVCEGSEVSLGDDQDMHRRLWMDVGKSKHVIIFEQTCHGNCARGDLAEEAVRSCSHVRMLNRGGYFLKYFGSIPGIHGL